MPSVVLSTMNARYAHPAFGLRYLHANLGPLQRDAAILEFEANRNPLEVATTILEHDPRIVGLGVYIWNVEALTRVAGLLKRLRPELPLVVGGPELGETPDDLELGRLADVAITGEADHAFRDVCTAMLRGDDVQHVVHPAPPAVADLLLPYDFYTDDDLAHRVTYVEASRGCPYECEFCLSALPVPVRAFPLAAFLAAMQRLLDRGARNFKFVDRTFNLDLATAGAILDFFLERQRPGLSLHFEMIPDRLPDALFERLARFPPGVVQLEIGIQSFDDEVNQRISRRQHPGRTETNLRRLRAETGAHLHTDLIAGLPGETLDGFAAGFDRLFALGPHEIQLGILKRLRGTPIVRHDDAFGMIYSPFPPYEVLRTSTLSDADLSRVRRFARYVELFVNSGNFPDGVAELLRGAPSPFRALLAFSEWLHARLGQAFGIALARQAELLFSYLVEVLGRDRADSGAAVARDWLSGGHSERPEALKPYLPRPSERAVSAARVRDSGRERQERHRRGES